MLSILSPLVDPEVDTTTGPMLPSKGSDEFKPFIRRLPKFKFWCSGQYYFAIGFVLLGLTKKR
ncbi:hypothetical protein OROGR_009098 [Orobanche gracilis]